MADPVISATEAALAAPLELTRRQLEALLEVGEAIAQQRDLPALFHDLAERLHSVVDFDFLTLILHDPARNVMRLHILETEHPTEKPVGMELPVDGHPSGWVWQQQETFVVSDTHEEPRYPEYMARLREKGVRSFALMPLTTAQRRVGAMGFGRMVPQRVTEGELQFMQRVASQVAVAVDNALNLESSQAYQGQLARERDRFRVLLDLNNVLVNSRELPERFRGIVATLQRVIQHDYTSLALLEPITGLLKIYALDFPGHQGLLKPEMVVSRGDSPAGRAIDAGKPLVARGAELDEYASDVVRVLRAEGLQTVCCIPLTNRARTFGTLNLASRSLEAFGVADIEFVQQVAAQIALAVENAMAFKEIDALKNKLAVEKLYLEEEIRTEFNFEEIIGESGSLKKALAQVELVAPAGTTALILGETGTGKECIARAIHNLSPRRERTFVKINCAAIPSGLLESELFGHERGAFTGAIGQKIGRFEMADKGTLFLDEVGDIPSALQPKLLRVLQEQEFERLGSGRTHKVDVRLVAATNRNLEKMVVRGQFRSDLYYRLNVFPILLPALRERREDIPALVTHFVKMFSRRMRKPIDRISPETMAAFISYAWPGNVRELENLVERAVILSRDGVLPNPPHKKQTELMIPSLHLTRTFHSSMTLEDSDRALIVNTLEQHGWVVGGPNGAATRLGLKRTTLHARMRRLGIKRPIFQEGTDVLGE